MAQVSRDSLGDRMKGYEDCFRFRLPERLPVVVRVDGRAFHSLNLKKPFDYEFEHAMVFATEDLVAETNAVVSFTASDEISLILWPWVRNESQAWFGNNLQKITSICASVATARLNDYATNLEPDLTDKYLHFDARAFVLPNWVEVTNYLLWRQKDWKRNSISMLAQAHFSQKALQGKSITEQLSMLSDNGVDWFALKHTIKYGLTSVLGEVKEIEDFTAPESRALIEGIPERMRDERA